MRPSKNPLLTFKFFVNFRTERIFSQASSSLLVTRDRLQKIPWKLGAPRRRIRQIKMLRLVPNADCVVLYELAAQTTRGMLLSTYTVGTSLIPSSLYHRVHAALKRPLPPIRGTSAGVDVRRERDVVR
jgi:hypothetical protein